VIIVPDTGSGPVGGADPTGVLLVSLALVTIGLSAIGSAIAVRRRYAVGRTGDVVRATGSDDGLDA
jgi:hypothetical protein